MELGIRQRAANGRPQAALRARVPAPSDRPLVRDDAASGRCPELDCLRGWLSKPTVEAAERRALEAGTGADHVLVSAGLLDEDIYVRLLCDQLGLAFEPLTETRRDACPLDDSRLIDAPAAGLLPVVAGDDLALVIAPRGISARRIIALVHSHSELSKKLRLTTAARLQSFVFRHSEAALGRRATTALAAAWPEMSAGPPRWKLALAPAPLACGVVLAALFLAPATTKFACDLLLTLIFLAWMILRIVGVMIDPVTPSRRGRIADHQLPIYTILAPLYREAGSIMGLVDALRRLDYPAEKIDIKLIVEPDDWETRDALEKISLLPSFEVIVSPDAGPRTKPKALNAALPFARGTFTVIYDAEDRPDPSQLRRALELFLLHDDKLACVQASLTIDNTADNWLAAMFTAEYAGQFDVFLPALTKLGLPLPLGGSSNHFRTTTLRAAGAWDPYNVTEDADLGVRLARLGYRSVAIDSATYEEAPARLGPWLRQRTRWFKGWMQTWLVHMRQPLRLQRELGLWAFLTVQLIVGGNVLASLVHPLLIVWLMVALALETPMWTSAAVLFGTTIACGYLASVLLGAVGLYRRGVLAYSWVLLLVPVHWLLLAVAAWRALFQLIRDPYRWEKTEHGLARTSRVQWNSDTEAALRQIAALTRRKKASSRAPA